MLRRIRRFFAFFRVNHTTRAMLRKFDWPLMIIVLAISLFGIVCIFSATSSEVTEAPRTVMEMLETQSVYYPRLQLVWLGTGLLLMMLMMVFPYTILRRERLNYTIYFVNIALLIITKLVAEVGRGGMQAFIRVGSGEHGIQPSEFGKVAMIICLAYIYSRRKKPLATLGAFITYFLYMFFPMILVVIQPDFGTALVYVWIFFVLLIVSGTDTGLLAKLLGIALVLAVTVWYAMNNTSIFGDFRVKRFLIWLYPNSYPDDARQAINAQIAVGSGGLWGKGIVSPGSFASLGYISDDHTDFIFAIVCESFGLVGGFALIGAYLLLILRLLFLALRVKDPFGSYIIMGSMAMLLFHIIENICMVIGLLPITGIPLPFVSYGGSNLWTNLLALGLVQNVVIYSRYSEEQKTPLRAVTASL